MSRVKVLDIEDIDSFFENCRTALKNANNRLDRISAALRKYMLGDDIKEEDKDLLFAGGKKVLTYSLTILRYYDHDFDSNAFKIEIKII